LGGDGYCGGSYCGLCLQGEHRADPATGIFPWDRLCSDLALRKRAGLKGPRHPFAEKTRSPVLGAPGGAQPPDPRNLHETACLRHIGGVTIILRKKRRNDGPKQVKNLVTNRPNMRARQLVNMCRRRWSVGLSIKLDNSVHCLDAIDAERPCCLKRRLHAWRIAFILAVLRAHTHNLKTRPTKVGPPVTAVAPPCALTAPLKSCTQKAKLNCELRASGLCAYPRPFTPLK
jgi:hypothetical protein